jgi:hypothetical protein
MQARAAHLVGCGWFWAWAFIGCAAALAAVSLGPLLFLPALAAGAFMATRPRIRASAFGLLTGAGALCLFVAWAQRRGPGEVCWQKGTATGCDQYLDPRPWLVLGVALVVSGIAAHAVRAHQSG